MNNSETSWGGVAGWYDGLLKKESTYQSEVVLPNLLRMMNIKKTDSVLDIACGQGFFTREFAKLSLNVFGADVSKELIEIAQKQNVENIKYFVSPADKLFFIEDKSVNIISIILALQNISHLSGVIKECSRILKSGGRLFLVLNHPAFRVPQKSDWGFDNKNDVQYRRVEKYLSEFMVNIDMNPGEKVKKNKKYTVSFHRPLQTYFKTFASYGFSVTKLEEWISNKKSQKGPRQKAEDIARKEIPMFMCIEATRRD